MSKLEPRQANLPIQRYPLNAENNYKRLLRAWIKQLRTICGDEIRREAVTLVRESHNLRTDALEVTGYAARVHGVLVRVATAMASYYRDLTEGIPTIAAQISDHARAEWNRITKAAYGVEVPVPEDWLADSLGAWRQRNLLLVEKLTATTLMDLEGGLLDRLRAGHAGVNDLTEELERNINRAAGRASMIARDQTITLNSTLVEKRQRQAGVVEYIWRTMGDERVRRTHGAHDGLRYRWDRPPENTGHPGNEHGCRCSPEPVFPALEMGWPQ